MSKPFSYSKSYLKFYIAVDSNQPKIFCVAEKMSAFRKIYFLFFILASIFFFSACNSGQANSAEQQKMKEQRDREINDSIIMDELFKSMTGNSDSTLNDISNDISKN